MTLPRPQIELQDGGGCVLLAPFAWTGPEPVTVPAGFFSDGSTIPAIVWPGIGHPYSLSLLRASLCHDYDIARGLPWEECTRRYRVRLAASGVGLVRRSLVIAAVTARGWIRQTGPESR